MRTRALLLLIVIGSLLPVPSFPMTVDEAYRSMPHRHVEIDPGASGLDRDEAAYLTRLFELVDLAIVEKTQTFVWFQSEGKRGAAFRDYKDRVDRLVAQIDSLPAPARLDTIHALLVQAIQEQRAFFQSWQEALDEAQQGKDNREAHRSRGQYLKSSSDKLHEVYDRLLRLFPGAGQRNLDAFYDHLCVLDLL